MRTCAELAESLDGGSGAQAGAESCAAAIRAIIAKEVAENLEAAEAKGRKP